MESASAPRLFPPGSGHDRVAEAEKYYISLLGKPLVATALGEDVYFRVFSNAPNQIWTCVRDGNHHFNFLNEFSGKQLTRNIQGNISAFIPGALGSSPTRFLPSLHTQGGVSLVHILEDVLQVVEIAEDPTGVFMRVGLGRAAQFGFHLLEEAVPALRRFDWVITDVLARSSAPNYNGEDSDQRMDVRAIEQLVKLGVKSIISLNEHVLLKDEIEGLTRKGITYFHSPIVDFSVPTVDRMQNIFREFVRNRDQNPPRSSLVYCGYGHGRTGTVITGIQMLLGRRFPNRAAYRDNHVETGAQMDFLDAFQKSMPG
ncbi:protein-tyrosine phosphatase-like protein [Mycena rosella]|uniref:Protein-tyrosine phosphatase-like protein n=1 Tax=Mycena rosella TaxID=1033263 RepID=A0AAD7C3A1_MYCRO|nr:protein-tyrosine phosphatase-like protein [Mycena rosella]